MPACLSTTQQRIDRAATPLPGGEPYENLRPVPIPASHHLRPLVEVLIERFPQVSPAEWVARCAAGRFIGRAGRVFAAADRLAAGERVMQRFPDFLEPPVSVDIRMVYEDEAILVIDKPAPLPMHPSGRFNRNTLQHILQLALAPAAPLALHRLDANTTGLVVFAQNRRCCRHLQQQFLAGAVEKHYRVRVAGQPEEERFTITAPISSKPGVTGTHRVDEAAGRAALTEFRVLRRLPDGTALLEARLATGRTNQIRVHLWQAGHPVCGDPAYLPGGGIGGVQTLSLAAPPLQLHARRLGFRHPDDNRPLEFVSGRQPEWGEDTSSGI
ncbi:MAG: RluA family pseudouridine synthase [Akkermansiaceae bacterium]|nr:RluA family pseudouridine synthase [Akkermansiaceae bacterium]